MSRDSHINRHTVAVLLLGALVVLAGCAGTSPGDTQTTATTAGDFTPSQTAPERTATAATASTPAETDSSTTPTSTTTTTAADADGDTDTTTATDTPTHTTEASSEEPSPTTSTATQSGAASPDGTLEIHHINVGQGDAILVIGPSGETMLIDTGDYTDDGEIVLDYLRQHDIDRIDYLITTHADADHIGGHEAVIARLGKIA